MLVPEYEVIMVVSAEYADSVFIGHPRCRCRPEASEVVVTAAYLNGSAMASGKINPVVGDIS
jgi:hypothetical protein